MKEQQDISKARSIQPPLHLGRPAKRASLFEEGRFLMEPEIASQILAQCNYEGQRSLESLHVNRLAAEMQAGYFTQRTPIDFGVLPDGRTVLVNGQHRLYGVVKSGCSLEVTIILHPVANEDELHRLYTSFDVVQRPRSSSAIMNATGIADEMGIGKETARKAYDAAVIIACGLKNINAYKRDPLISTPNGRLDTLQEWWPTIKIYDDLIRDARRAVKRNLLTASIMSIGLVTIRYQADRASEFWRGVAADDRLAKNDPRKTLLILLETIQKHDVNDTLSRAACCWNAWFRNEKLSQARGYAEGCVLLGTPYGKKGRT